MPFALVFIAVALIVAGFRGTQNCLFYLLQQDASGQFIAWGGAIIVVGGIGYIKPLEPVSTALLALIIVVLFLGHSGVFTQAAAALNQNTPPTAPTTTATSAGTGTTNSSAQTNSNAQTTGAIANPLAYGAQLLGSGQEMLAGSGVGSNPGPGTGGLY